jgi:hypothetical protein
MKPFGHRRCSLSRAAPVSFLETAMTARRQRPAPKPGIRTLSLAAALERLRQPDHELVSLHLPLPEGGHGYFIAPNGGRVKDEDVETILRRPDMQPYSDGLFPENVQTWRMVRRS